MTRDERAAAIKVIRKTMAEFDGHLPLGIARDERKKGADAINDVLTGAGLMAIKAILSDKEFRIFVAAMGTAWKALK